MKSKKRLCLVIPSLQSGGMERVMAELANYFVGQPNTEVHLILYGLKRDIFYTIDENINVHRPGFAFNNQKRLWYTFKTLFFLRKQIKKLHPDTVLSFGEVWNNFVLLACWGVPYPVYVSDRCQPDKQWSRLQRNLRNWLYPRASGIIAQTQKAKDIYRQLFPHSNIQVIGNPIRTIEPDPKTEKENIVLSVGRLIKTKHHDELIKIFAELNPEDWKLIIVGDDALKQQNMAPLQQLIDDLGMQSKIELAGKRKNVEDYYNRAKIFAFTSSSEGFPNVIGEAMSAGLPVISYDCVAGPSDLVQHGQTGFLIKLHDMEDFCEKLKLLIYDKDLREQMGIAGQEKVKELAVEKIAQKFQKILLD